MSIGADEVVELRPSHVANGDTGKAAVSTIGTVVVSKPAPPATIDPLTVGILIDRDWLFAWEAKLVENLAATETLKLEIIVRCQNIGSHAFATKLWQWSSSIDARLSHRFLHGQFKAAGLDHDARVPLSKFRLDGIRLVDRRNAFEVETALSYDLELPRVDAIIDLTNVAGQLPTKLSAHFGTFRLFCGARSAITGEEDGSDEVLRDEPHSECRVVFTPADGSEPIVLSRQFRTYRYSWSENLRRLHWSGSMFLLDAIRDLAARSPASIESRGDKLALPRRAVDLGPPSLWQSLRAASALPTILFRLGGRFFQRYVTHDQWRICLCTNFKSIGEIESYRTWEAIVPPNDRMWADPFIMRKDGRTIIFVEELELSTNKGIIACLEHSSRGVERLGVIIEEEHHLSYPFLFEYKDVMYMLPESSASKQTQLWKCVDFPMRWEREQIFLSGTPIVDSTIFFHDQTWWLFGTVDRVGGGDFVSELHIFHADNPIDGSWKSHPLNPVLVDDRCARMAGTIGQFDGRLLRFGQGSGREYGEILQIRQITRLSKTDYAEEKLKSVRPQSKDIGLHHFSRSGEFAVIDACTRKQRSGAPGVAARIVASTPLSSLVNKLRRPSVRP